MPLQWGKQEGPPEDGEPYCIEQATVKMDDLSIDRRHKSGRDPAEDCLELCNPALHGGWRVNMDTPGYKNVVNK